MNIHEALAWAKGVLRGDFLDGTGIYLDEAHLLIGIVCAAIAYMTWRYARQRGSGRHFLLAIILVIFPYFIGDLRVLAGVAAVLIFFLFWP